MKALLQSVRKRLRVARRVRRASRLMRQGRREEAVVELARTNEGWFRSSEIALLYRTVKALPGPGNLAEIGSWKGRSTAVTAMALKDAGDTEAKIFAIDPHVGSEEHRDTIEREGPTLIEFRKNLRRLHLYDQVEEMVAFSYDAAKILAERGESLRFVLIDGAHDYGSVKKDIQLFRPMVRDGGIIALHDCEPDGGAWPEVWQAYEDELAEHVELLDRAASLTVTRVKSRGA